MKIFERPNGKYWTEADVQELEKVKTYHEMALIAMRILERIPGSKTQICGPISTGGKGSKEENMKEFNKAIFFFHQQGENVFDQVPFQEAMTRLSREVNSYDTRVLTDFYLPLFESGKVTTFIFLPGWRSSKGARWENEQIKKIGYKIIYLPKNWDIIKLDK